jgi:hypothetical protein
MTARIPGKLQERCPDFPSKCDICGKPRNNRGGHIRCSKVRQERHAQMLRNEEFDNLLMDDKREKR